MDEPDVNCCTQCTELKSSLELLLSLRYCGPRTASGQLDGLTFSLVCRVFLVSRYESDLGVVPRPVAVSRVCLLRDPHLCPHSPWTLDSALPQFTARFNLTV